MPKFQGSGFSLELPGGTVDASNYGFALPGSGGANPTLTIRITKTAHADLGAIFDEHVADEFESYPRGRSNVPIASISSGSESGVQRRRERDKSRS